MHADPEETMRALYAQCARAGVRFVFGEAISDAARGGAPVQDAQDAQDADEDAGAWLVRTDRGTRVACRHLVFAAGYNTRRLFQRLFQLELGMAPVLGVIAELDPQFPREEPYVRGLVMGTRSLFHWAWREALSRVAGGRPNLDVTHRPDGTVETTHLYVSSHGGRVRVGGPRILLRDDFTPRSLDCAQYHADIAMTLAYANELIRPPEGGWTVRGCWSAVMAFPVDDDVPLVGPVGHGFPGLYTCTGFASGGYREGFGAGAFLAQGIADAGKLRHWSMADDAWGPLSLPGNPDTASFRRVLPVARVRRVGLPDPANPALGRLLASALGGVAGVASVASVVAGTARLRARL